MKQWKKEDFSSKYITISSEEQGKKVIKFLESLGIKQDMPLTAIYKSNIKAVFIYSYFTWKYTPTHSEDYKFSDLQLEEKEQILTTEQTLSIDDLVKYEYYHTKDRDSDFWMLFRFKQIESSNNQAFYTCCITKYKEFTKEDWLNISSRRITRKATAEEIQWLEICSKENKFIELDKVKDYMNKETKFEVGDWVFIKDDQKNSLGEGVKFDKVINNCLQIEKLNGNFVIQLSGINCSLNSGRFRKALPHEILNNSSVNTFNFEENKYYSCIDTYLNSNTLWHFQFKFLKENQLHYTWGKNYEELILKNDYLTYSRFKDFKLVTEQEAKGLPKQEESLIGRWLKCNKNTSDWKAGKYYKILKGDKFEKANLTIEDDGTSKRCMLCDSFNYFELMPIGFIPPSVNQPIKEENMFKQGDYIILNKSCFSHSLNFCYKQRENCEHLRAYLDDNKNSSNGDTGVKFINKYDWRYATSEEIAEYNKIGKPFDVIKLNKSKKEDLLSLAKFKYPIGTEYFNNSSKNKVKGILNYIQNTDQITDGYGGSVYFKGKWAEIVKQEDNSIPEYVECIKKAYTDSDFTIGKVYKIKNNFVYSDSGKVSVDINYTTTLGKGGTYSGNSDFKISSKEAYDKQYYPLTPEQCINSDVIEVGDIVTYKEGRNKHEEVVGFHKDDKWLKLKGREEQRCNPKSYKIIKKNTTTTTINHKKPDISSAEVGNTSLLRFEDNEEGLFDTSIKKIKSIKTELVEI